MNREIKFRGCSKQYKTWEKGFLVIHPDGQCFISRRFKAGQWVEVVPESVGQYTGLEHKNGVEIFEGDILFDDHHEEYGLVSFEEGKFSVLWETETDDLFENYDVLEIAGNIYENPELLKGATDAET